MHAGLLGGGEKNSRQRVIVIEIVNSAIETMVDRVGAERNELSGRAKDLGSAAVFAAIVLAGVVWLLVLTGRQT